MIEVTARVICDQCGRSTTLEGLDPADSVYGCSEARKLQDYGWYINAETDDILCKECADKLRDEE